MEMETAAGRDVTDPPPPPVFARGPFALQQWPFGAVMRPGDWVAAGIFLGCAAFLENVIVGFMCAAVFAVYLAASTD